MPLIILDPATAAAVAAAATQQAQCAALIAPWTGGNVTARLFGPDGTTLLRTLTLGPWTINTASPRAVVAAAHLADTHVATGTPGLWVFRSGSTDIFSVDAGTTGASINHAGTVRALCTPTLVGVTFGSVSALPPNDQPDINTAIYGDSLTDERTDLNRNLHPFFWINGIAAKGAQRLVANCGINGNTASQMLARVNNTYTNASPGLSGLPSLGITYLRGFANDARAGSSWASIAATVNSLITAILSYSERLIILSPTPIGTPDAGFATSNALQAAYAVELQAIAAANPRITYADDNVNTRDGSGDAVAVMFTDGVHTSGRGIRQQGVDGAAALSSLFSSFAYADPVVTDPADTTPSTGQLVPNPTMAGTGGTAGTGFTGTVADSWTIATTSGSNAGTLSKVAADGGDPNQTPWQRVTMTATSSGSIVRLSIPFAGPLSASSEPIDMIFQVRFNALGPYFNYFKAYVTNGTTAATNDLDLKMGGTTITGTVTARLAYRRINSTALTSPEMRIDVRADTTTSGSLGSFDIRCVSARQL